MVFCVEKELEKTLGTLEVVASCALHCGGERSEGVSPENVSADFGFWWGLCEREGGRLVLPSAFCDTEIEA